MIESWEPLVQVKELFAKVSESTNKSNMQSNDIIYHQASLKEFEAFFMI